MGRHGDVAKLLLPCRSQGAKCVRLERGIVLEIALSRRRYRVRVRQEGGGVDGLATECCRCKADKAGGDERLLEVLPLFLTKGQIPGRSLTARRM